MILNKCQKEICSVAIVCKAQLRLCVPSAFCLASLVPVFFFFRKTFFEMTRTLVNFSFHGKDEFSKTLSGYPYNFFYRRILFPFKLLHVVDYPPNMPRYCSKEFRGYSEFSGKYTKLPYATNFFLANTVIKEISLYPRLILDYSPLDFTPNSIKWLKFVRFIVKNKFWNSDSFAQLSAQKCCKNFGENRGATKIPFLIDIPWKD